MEYFMSFLDKYRYFFFYREFVDIMLKFDGVSFYFYRVGKMVGDYSVFYNFEELNYRYFLFYSYFRVFFGFSGDSVFLDSRLINGFFKFKVDKKVMSELNLSFGGYSYV